MKKDYKNIEDLFRDSFNGYKIEPSSGTWKDINGKLNLKQFLSPGFKHFNVYYLSAVVGIISAIALAFADNDQLETSQTKLNAPTKTEIVKDKTTNNTDKTNTISINRLNDQKKIRIQQKVEKQKSTIVTESSRVSEVIPFTQNQKLEQITDGSVDSESELNKITVSPPKPLFKLNNKIGCAPFKIKLNNHSELANNYEWTFGDGHKSKEKNPTHTYIYPGVYTVSLKAKGLGGIAISVMDSVVVHEGVSNKISTSFDSKLNEGEWFAISVKNNQNAEYEWNFGDGNYSFEKNPTHVYEKEGIYSISLITLTENNCYDSVEVAEAVVVKSNKKFVFPSAFSPNPNGPSIGKYADNDVYNNIFHPKVKGELAEYSLRIFAKTGLLIFESKDLKIGWDGYYQNRLMPAGVYPYVVTLKFEGDTKPIQQRRNVTIVHKK